MPSIIVEYKGRRRGLVLDGRVLIGRRAISGLTLESPDVSRLHAWISAGDHGHYYLADSFSRTGTWVNGHRIASKWRLNEGDQIRVGPANITYHTASRLPRDVGMIATDVNERLDKCDGILFDCVCGAPLWVAEDLAGRSGACQHCGKTIRVPRLKPRAVKKVEAPEPVLELEPVKAPEPVENCSICQSGLAEGEEKHVCPECALTFHEDCWVANHGCSAYGCSQVNVLDKPAEKVEEKFIAKLPEPQTEKFDDPSREFLYLGLSVLGLLVGALLFGVPALVIGAASVVYAARHRARVRVGVTILSVAISLSGVVLGVVVSRFWWLGQPLPWGGR